MTNKEIEQMDATIKKLAKRHLSLDTLDEQ